MTVADSSATGSEAALAQGEPQALAQLGPLNPAQAQAVRTTEGPVLMLAGAGTGKTRALTARLAHLILSARAWPSQILAVTFTNKAAREMVDRVAHLIGPEGTGPGMAGPGTAGQEGARALSGWWLGTFHALAARQLRRHAELVGLQPNFSILDADDQLRLLRQVLTALNIDPKAHPPRTVLGVIEGWKDRAIRPADLTAEMAVDLADGRMPAVYGLYQQRLAELNACDFGDLLAHMIHILRSHPDVLARWHRQFRYLLVDEYQDTNIAQYLWLRLLAQGSNNLCVVGDDDQSIYGWRGAEVGNILRFEQDFPGATVIRLEQNYRSTGHILGAANGLIAQNRNRLGKTLFTNAGDGDRVRVQGLWDGEAEARWVISEIERLSGWPRNDGPIGLDQTAILVRTGNQMRAFEERLNYVGMPYRVVGGPRFYERAEIRDAIAYFRVTVQPEDDLALERIINTPKRGVGAQALATLQQEARSRRTSLHGAIAALVGDGSLRPQLRRALGDLLTQLEGWRRALAPEDQPPLSNDGRLTLMPREQPAAAGAAPAHVRVAERILQESGYVAHWQADKTPEAQGRLENLKELVTAIHDFPSLSAFLEHVALVMDTSGTGSDGARVTLMTLHAAKGLEFDAVFLPGWEEGLFPGMRAMEENGLAGLEEERRLAYVGLTRARRLAIISHVANRQVRGSWMSQLPSRFIDELPEDHIAVERVQGMPQLRRGGLMDAYREDGGWQHGGGARGASWQAPVIDADATTVGYQPARLSAPPPKVSGDGTGYKVARRGPSDQTFSPGDRVRNRTLGEGVVVAVERCMVEVAFDQGGTRKVIDRFLEAVG